MTNEAILSQRHHFTQKTMRLDSRARTYADGTLNFDERSYEAVIGNLTTVQVRGFDDSDAFAEDHVLDSNLTQ